MSFVSVRTRANFSPARNVRSTTAPLSSDFSFVRTKAPPLPGFTCWNSTMRQKPPSSSMCIPFLNWFVLTVSATDVKARRFVPALPCGGIRERALSGRAAQGHATSVRRRQVGASADRDQVLAEPGEVVDAAVADGDVVLDPDARPALQVDPRLDRDDVAGGQRVGGFRRHPRRLVHLEPEPVAEPMAEGACE